MAGRIKRIWGFLTKKQLKAYDVLLLILTVVSLVYVYKHYYEYDLAVESRIAVESPWMVKGDGHGALYVVDTEKARILEVRDGAVEHIIHGGAPSGDTFYYAENICVTEAGHIYVQDTAWSGTGFSLDGESILKYDSKGRSQGVCYEQSYDGVYRDKHCIFGLDSRGDSLYFVYADEEGFSLNEMNTLDNQVSVLDTYKMEDAITLVQDFVIDTENLDVYVIDKRGILLRASRGEAGLQILHQIPESAPGEDSKTALYRGAIGRDGTVYITDIASERLLAFREAAGYEMETVLEGSQMWNVYCGGSEDGRELLYYVADGAISIADTMGNPVSMEVQYGKSAAYGMGEGIFDFLAVTAFVCCLLLGARLLALLFTASYSNSQKISALVISTVLVVSVIIVYGLMGQFRDIYRNELLIKLSMTAQIVSNNMEQDYLDDVEQPQHYMNHSYQKLWSAIDTVLDKDYEFSGDMYCNILRYSQDSGGYALLYLDNSIGTYYPLTEDETQAVKEVYETGVTLQSDIQSETGSYIYVMTPIIGEGGEVAGVVSVGTLSSVINGKISAMTGQIIIAMIMIILAIMFLFGEILSFFDLRDRYRAGRRTSQAPVPMHIVRLAVFVTFMAFNMATSFLPVYIIRFVREDMGIPTALANSLPMTLNLVFIGLTSLICPKLINRLGFARLAAVSSFIALCGDLLMACSVDYSMILAGLVLNGIGVGLITNSIHIFIASVSGQEENSSGFSIFNAASLSGVNCGMLLGSALAERMGQSRVYFVSSAAWAVVALVFIVVGGRLVMKKSQETQEGTRRRGLTGFIFTPSVLKFILCVQVPYIVINSFTYYYVPIYSSSHGLTENISSLLIIVCSLCSVYLSVSATDYLSRRFKDKAMYLSTVITFAGLLFFALNMSLPSLIVALVLIGVANSFGAATRISYFIGMKESAAYGEENAMGAYDFVDNVGESTGSMIFAGIISIGFLNGILGLIGCVGGLNAIYALTNRRAGKAAGLSQEERG